MREDILKKLFELTEEEKQILEGEADVDKSIYTDESQFIIDSNKILAKDQLINIRKHTRFVEFPEHKHNYIEFNYVYKGKLTEVIYNKEINLKEGEIIFLNKDITHKIKESSKDDIIINFIIKPEFFDFLLSLSNEENTIFSFLLKSIYMNNNKGEYLYFKVNDERYIQEILEKIIIEIYEPSMISSTSIKLLVGLLIVELIKTPDKIEMYSEDNYDSLMVIDVFKYIDNNYAKATLTEVSERLNQPNYKISKLIKKHTDMTFKELLQEKRLDIAKKLLSDTELPIVEVITSVGYENLTYFYKIFKEKYGCTPNEFKSYDI
ncbi:AraC family transcriptional regulator [Clostridium sp. NSJ-49]|uniref:AraC family transcriptional regulator n=1 Tax=unclassified Clostridium TaxID=2614128 RepID=UPI00164AA76E|nr:MULTISPECIES: AraC family transcriptional regulator [unclassified Clostridium]MBC5625837.1 AraC family transcriptional regulator [Clostridium sp. NSJ-49]MCD2503127.1 AraC family transcriptional regulator [Clostridium sp. NSJ-145]